jgi:hypothetical protein
MLLTGNGVKVKQVAERDRIVGLWFICAIADVAQLIKTKPWVRATRIRGTGV